ncbi:hypothetical protein HGE74_09475 [Rhodobacteraceae bacterium R_SAG1]|nr:hypothetical protein [Rhodobacteraceae bacterium R_SAG1]
MTKGALQSKIESVDWGANISHSFGSTDIEEVMTSTLKLIAVWSMQFEKHDTGNPALTFIREMQVALQQVAALLPMGLYKSAAATIRSAFECGLYYTYFRNHPAELATLIRDEKYYASKSDIIEYHKLHTAGFNSAQAALGLLSSLNKWYASISAITHGQRPGAWTTHSSIQSIGFDKNVATDALNTVLELKDINSNLFLCTAGKELWVKFDPEAVAEILKGRSKEEIQKIGL